MSERERAESHRETCWRRICCVEIVNKSFPKEKYCTIKSTEKERHLEEHLNIVPPARVPVCACQQRKMSKQSVDVHRQIYWIIKSKRNKRPESKQRTDRATRRNCIHSKWNKIKSEIKSTVIMQSRLYWICHVRARLLARPNAHTAHSFQLKIVHCY